MRIATWNVNGLNARLDYVGHWLRAVSPDVVGLQELKMTDDKFPHDAFAALGYRALTHGQRSWNGVAVLSREPARATQVGLPSYGELGARLLAAEVAGITFVTVYCPNGKTVDHEDFAGKLAWLDALAAWLEQAHDPSAPLVLCGDFNVVPAAIDSWNEERLRGGIFHTDAERARLARLCDWGLVDLWRHLRPDDPGHSWWDYRAGAFHKRMGLRIDLVLGTAPIAARAAAAHVARDWRKKVEGLTPSDHAPVWVDLD
ncbi:MAG: exodeoxyribonuclease III [Sandaracinaceae bacterium]|nr:exodeoxyribonuclease III [Sandaracinaceae bacterium]